MTGVLAPAAAGSATVPIQTRSERPVSFDPDDFAAPTRAEIGWKHSDLDRLAPLLADDAAAAALTIAIDAPEAVTVGALAVGAAPRGEIFRPEDRASAIAWARSAEATHIRIPAEAELDAPVIVRLDGAAAAGRATDHLVIEALPGSTATVVLRHAGVASYAQNVEILVREGASLTLVSLQGWGDEAIHASAHQAVVADGGHLTHFVVSFGGGVVRVNPSVRLAGTRSRADLFGIAFADAGQHLESQVYLFHEGRDTEGDVLYKAALRGHGARTVWIGDVLIGPAASGTMTYEANRNLVLSDEARADSIPNLEIETGDIRGAGHASATGRFDDEQLFYLQSRGIPEDEAKRLVVLGFLVEIAQRIPLSALEDEVIASIEAELTETGIPRGAAS